MYHYYYYDYWVPPLMGLSRFLHSETHTFVPHLMFSLTCLVSSVNILWHFGLPGFVVQAERSPRAESEDGFCKDRGLQLSYTSHVQSREAHKRAQMREHKQHGHTLQKVFSNAKGHVWKEMFLSSVRITTDWLQ